MEVALFVIYRILTALPVLRWPLAGAFIAIIGDLCDLFLLNLVHLGTVNNYQQLDKYMDLAYMGTFLIVALRWRQPEKGIAIGLFGFRMIGFALFEAVDARYLLMAFPNVFEFWFVGVAATHHFRPRFSFTPRWIAAFLAVTTAGKLFQEYTLHVGRWFDSFTIIDATKNLWHWLTPF